MKKRWFIGWRLLLLTLVGISTQALAQVTPSNKKIDPGSRSFTISDAGTGENLLTVPFYFAPGEVKDVSAVDCVSQGARFTAQARVLSRHPGDGSVRAILIRSVTNGLQAGQNFSVAPVASAGKPLLTVTGRHAEFNAGPRRVVLDGGTVTINRGNAVETTVTPLAPRFPQEFYGPRIQIVENGPEFAWIQCVYQSYPWNLTFEVKADRSGQVELISRIVAVNGTQAFPDLGFTGSLPSGERKADGTAFTGNRLLLRDDKRAEGKQRMASFTAGTTAFVFPDGAHIRQGVLETEGTNFRLFRDPALDNLQKAEYVFHEGQERSFKLALAAPGATILRYAHGTVSGQRRAAVVMESAPTDWGELDSIRKSSTALAPKLQCLDGDDWGDVTGDVSRDKPVYRPTSLTRLDLGEDWLEDYYLGGDPILRDVAVRWAENYLDLHLYRGWDLNGLGGERYALTAEDNLPNFNQKGLFLLIHAYEETGDVRYREAGLAAADRAVGFMNTQAFFPSYDLHERFGNGNNTRTAYFAVDLLKFYRYTGDEKYLEAAQRIIDNLEEMRQRTAATPELTTNYHIGQKTPPLLSEGISDPYSMSWLALRGDDVGTATSPGGFPKPFILDYHLRGANAVYGATKSPESKALMIQTADFLANKRNIMGSWGYPQTNSPIAMVMMPALIGGSLLQSYELTGDKRYLDVGIEQAKYLVQLCRLNGDFTFNYNLGVGKPYFYGQDVTLADVQRGSLTTGTISRDALAHFFDLMDTYFRLFPAQAAKLLEPLQNDATRWVVEKAPLQGHPERPVSPILSGFQAAVTQEPARAFEETLVNSGFSHEIGNCFMYRLRNESPSDDAGGKSTLKLFEDGKELGPAHALHADIRNLGQGRWSHWGGYGSRMVLISTSDNSSPMTNGRTYTVRQEASGSVDQAVAAWEAYLQKYPDSPFEYLRLADLLSGSPREVEYIEKFIAAFPKHPRSGTARLRLYRLTNDDKWLRQTLEALPGSIWAREAEVLLWAKGTGERPSLLLTNDGVAATNFRESRNLQTAARQTEIKVRREGDDVVLNIVGHDWKKGDPGSSSLHLYFDSREDHERWTRFEIDADSDQRRYQPPTWPGIAPSPIANETDWSVKQTRQGNDLSFEVRIPLAKLEISATNTKPVLLGFDAVRIEPDSWSFWSRTTNTYNVLTGDFGRLLLK